MSKDSINSALAFVAKRLKFYAANTVDHRCGLCNWLTHELEEAVAEEVVGEWALDEANPYDFMPVAIAYLTGKELDMAGYIEKGSGQTKKRQEYAAAIANLILTRQLILTEQGPVARGVFGEVTTEGRVRP